MLMATAQIGEAEDMFELPSAASGTGYQANLTAERALACNDRDIRDGQ